MKSPATTLPLVPGSVISTPCWRLPEMTLGVPAAVPPIVLFVAPPWMITPLTRLGRTLPEASEADPVPLDRVVRGPGERDHDAVVGVARDDVAGGRGGPAHRVERRPGDEIDAVIAVGQAVMAGDIGADVIPFDQVAGRTRVGDVHAPLGIARDDVAGGGGGPADRAVPSTRRRSRPRPWTFPTAAVPAKLVPIRSPSTRLLLEPAIQTP